MSQSGEKVFAERLLATAHSLRSIVIGFITSWVQCGFFPILSIFNTFHKVMRGWNVSCNRGFYSMLSYIPSLSYIIIIIIIIITSFACLLGNTPLLPIRFFTLDRQEDALMFEAGCLVYWITEHRDVSMSFRFHNCLYSLCTVWP